MDVEKLVEAVARAIRDSRFTLVRHKGLAPPPSADDMEAARAGVSATLEALREPTPGMIAAGEAVECEGSSGFTAMIEAAIKEMGDG